MDSIGVNEIMNASNNDNIVKIVQEKFNRMSSNSAKKLIIRVLKFSDGDNIPVSFVDKSTTFEKRNSSSINIFNNKKCFKADIIINLRVELIELLKNIHQYEVYDEEQHKDIKMDEAFDGDCFVVNKDAEYQAIRKVFYETNGKNIFKYNFMTPDIPLINDPDSTLFLQRCKVQVMTKPIRFDYPLEYLFRCPRCESVWKRAYDETVCTNDKLTCEGEIIIPTKSGIQKKRCGTTLYPDINLTKTTNAYYYTVSFSDISKSSDAITFINLPQGEYECVLFRIANPWKNSIYHIIDVKEIGSNDFKVPEQKPEENYLFTLQKELDTYIEKQMGIRLFGMNPIKISLILQAICNELDYRRDLNVMVVGNASTGKTMTTKYYGSLLHGRLHKMTNAMSVSIPNLRGTRKELNLFGGKYSIVTHGMLGTYNSIVIDEAGQNKMLIEELKAFLLDANYSYDKAGGEDGLEHKRLSHVNVTQNIDNTHLGQYRGSIKKTYRELEGDDKIPWDESWNLHLPLYEYSDNPYLYKTIKDKREEYKLKQVFWIDGYDYALHERFPFYFYLVANKTNTELTKIVYHNSIKSEVDSDNNITLIRALYSKNITNLLQSFKEFESETMDDDVIKKLDGIFDDYDMKVNARQLRIFLMILKLSRMANRRNTISEMDYDLVRWFIENINCERDVADLASYSINGPKKHVSSQEMEDKMDKISRTNDRFGLPLDEFTQGSGNI